MSQIGNDDASTSGHESEVGGGSSTQSHEKCVCLLLSPTYAFPTYAYNRTDKLLSITYPSGRTINTIYDQAGRISGVSGFVSSGTTNYASSITYASPGGISTMALRNSQMTEQWCYNSRLQPTGIRLGASANAANV